MLLLAGSFAPGIASGGRLGGKSSMMKQLVSFLQKFQEFLAPMFDLARHFRGFLAFGAFAIIAVIVLVVLLFPQGSFGAIVGNFDRLTPDQFFALALAVIGLALVFFLLIAVLYSRDITLSATYALTVLVHEAGDPTRPVPGAEVSLALDETIVRQADQQGAATFAFDRRWLNRTCAVNARHPYYAARQHLPVTLKPSDRVLIPLTPDPAALASSGQEKVYVSFSPGNRRAAEAISAQLTHAGFSVVQVGHARREAAIDLGVEQGIRRADAVVAVISSGDASVPVVPGEVDFAREVRKPIIPVRLDPAAPLPGTLGIAPPIDIYTDWGEEGERLVNTLREAQPPPLPSDPEVIAPPGGSGAQANPFVYGGAVRDDLFVGRKDVIEAIVGRLGPELQSVSIVANRRMGKTSLLNLIWRRYKQLLPAEHTWIVAYLDMMSARMRTPADAMRLLRQRIAASIKRDLWSERYDGQVAVMAEKFEELAESNVRLVLCLDEWESVMAHREMDIFLEQLRSSGSVGMLGMVVATAHELIDLKRSGMLGSPFDNIFETVYLGLMPQEEWHELVRRAYRRSKREVRPAELALIGALAGGHPCLTQMAGHVVWAARDRGWNRAEIWRQYSRRVEPVFAGLWNRQTAAQKTAVRQALGIISGEPAAPEVWEKLKLRGVLTADGEVFCRPFADYVLSCEL